MIHDSTMRYAIMRPDPRLGRDAPRRGRPRRVRWASLALAVLVAPVAVDAFAVGLGKLRVKSALNQPLHAEIELLSVSDAELHTLDIGLGSRSDFRRAGIERSSSLSLIGFRTSVGDDGRPLITVSSRQPMAESFLHFLVALEWPGGKLIREYTVLLDPARYASNLPEEPVARDAPSGGGTYGPVRRGDTLFSIVGLMRLEPGVDVYQAMFAVFRKNPGAFIRNNINLLMRVPALALPTHEEIASISKGVASAEYGRHLDEWQAYRRQPADRSAAPRLDVQDAAPTPSETPEPVAAALPAPEGIGAGETGLPQDILRIIQPDETSTGQGRPGGGSEEIADLQSQLLVIKESLLSAELENAGLNERIAVLEQDLKETNKLLEVYSAGLALAEQKAAAPEPPEPVVAAQPVAPQPVASAQAVDSTSPETPGPVGSILSGVGLELDAVALLGAVALLVGVLLYLRRRRAQTAFDEDEESIDIATRDIESPRQEQTTDLASSLRAGTTSSILDGGTEDGDQSSSLLRTSFMTEMAVPGMGAMQAAEVDPAAEAEVYMAYGRDQQAMEVLEDAIQRDPGRHELKIKLLDVYRKRKDVRAFESLAEELHGAIGQDPVKWSQVVEMGHRLLPAHPLFARPAAPAAQAGAAEQPRASGVIEFEPVGSVALETAPPSVGSVALDAAPPPGDASRNDDVATKLDLAKIYMDMGDGEAACGYLDEVLKEGDETQRRRASELVGGL